MRAKTGLFFLLGFAFFLTMSGTIKSLAEALDISPITFEAIPDETNIRQWTYQGFRPVFYSDPDGAIIPAVIFHDYISVDKKYIMVVAEIFGQKTFWLWKAVNEKQSKVGFKEAGRSYIGDRSTLDLKAGYDEHKKLAGFTFSIIPDGTNSQVNFFIPRK